MTLEFTGLAGKVAVVTGAGRMRSIGRGIAGVLAAAGCDVVVTGTGRDPTTFPDEERTAGWRDIASVAAEIEELGRRALPLVTDISDATAIDSLLDTVVGEFGRVDILVNNASAARGPDRVPVTDLDPEIWRRVLDVNLTGTFLLSRATARRWLAEGVTGSIVNISSIGGKLMAGTTAAYSASKAAVHALTSAMAQELGPNGIRVNAICPGVVDTSRLDDIPRGAAWDHLLGMIPLRRAGTPVDVANMVAYLCSDQGAWITGQQFNVDGGQLTIR